MGTGIYLVEVIISSLGGDSTVVLSGCLAASSLLGLGCFNRLDVRLFDCALLLLDCRFLLFNEYDLLGLFVYLWLAITHGTPKYIFPVSPYVQMLLPVDLENVQIVKDFNGKASFSLPRYKLKAKIAGSYSQLLIGTVKQQFFIWLTIDVAQAVQQFLVDLFCVWVAPAAG